MLWEIGVMLLEAASITTALCTTAYLISGACAHFHKNPDETDDDVITKKTIKSLIFPINLTILTLATLWTIFFLMFSLFRFFVENPPSSDITRRRAALTLLEGACGVGALCMAVGFQSWMVHRFYLIVSGLEESLDGAKEKEKRVMKVIKDVSFSIVGVLAAVFGVWVVWLVFSYVGWLDGLGWFGTGFEIFGGISTIVLKVVIVRKCVLAFIYKLNSSEQLRIVLSVVVGVSIVWIIRHFCIYISSLDLK